MTDYSDSMILSKTKACKVCGEEKPLTDFHKYHLKCKLCFNADCRERKRVRLSDPSARIARNAMEREGRRKRIEADPEYHRARENENAARQRAKKASLNPKLPKPPTSRQIAKQNGDDRYLTGMPCNNGHTEFRSTKTGVCMECARNAALQYRHDNIELCRQKDRDRYDSDPEGQKARKRDYDERNRELVNERARMRVGDGTRAACRIYYNNNKEERARYRRANRGRYAAHANNRREKIIRATLYGRI